MENTVKLGKYKHFKGAEVEVLGVARHSETLEELVVYKKLVDHGGHKKGEIWVRPVAMFLESVDRDGEVKPRFEWINI
ncbi:DUF1653 domain-containing protein [Patescibacteria group bacterium]|nr:DUF1653 domain-containing protein [Patescibacteria group bacterium]MBU1721750.1 DUF1653 domain-containing protein [Patescibacteria group bacterium]MBU1901411.1 DUF1653 domain-containing protein [Patescibacteria group bacterium]